MPGSGGRTEINMKLLACSLLAWAAIAAGAPGEDPLREGDFSRHLSGPALEVGSLAGKVVLLEYFGYR